MSWVPPVLPVECTLRDQAAAVAASTRSPNAGRQSRAQPMPSRRDLRFLTIPSAVYGAFADAICPLPAAPDRARARIR